MTSTTNASPASRGAAIYLVVQAMLVLLWWAAVLGSRTARQWFFPYGGLDPAFVAFVVPDLVFIVGGSLSVARAQLRGAAAPRATGVLLGALGYGTLYTLVWTVLLHAPPTGAIAMVALAVGTWRACR